jgi:hypothetical protein
MLQECNTCPAAYLRKMAEIRHFFGASKPSRVDGFCQYRSEPIDFTRINFIVAFQLTLLFGEKYDQIRKNHGCSGSRYRPRRLQHGPRTTRKRRQRRCYVRTRTNQVIHWFDLLKSRLTGRLFYG